jgi:hypothetical protein
MELRAPLAHDDVPGFNRLATVGLHPKPLAVGVTTVLGRALTFLMCHFRTIPRKKYL